MSALYKDIIERGLRHRSLYTRFLKSLKTRKRLALDSLFQEAHEAAFAVIDCLECGRCCKHLGPRVKDRDLKALAKQERLKPASFAEKYLRIDEDGDMVFKTMPCPFFASDGYCTVYESRPGACRDYPHLDNGRQWNQIRLHVENLEYCPAVILAVENLNMNIGTNQRGHRG